MSFTPQERRLLALSDSVEARPHINRAASLKPERVVAALRSTPSLAAAGRKLGFARDSNFYRFLDRQGISTRQCGLVLVVTVRIRRGGK